MSDKLTDEEKKALGELFGKDFNDPANEALLLSTGILSKPDSIATAAGASLTGVGADLSGTGVGVGGTGIDISLSGLSIDMTGLGIGGTLTLALAYNSLQIGLFLGSASGGLGNLQAILADANFRKFAVESGITVKTV